MTQKAPLGKHAIVVGGSIAGMLSARVLSEYFDHVTILESEEAGAYEDIAFPARRYAPQGRHLHILLNSGEEAISKLFPGFDQDLLSAGALAADFSKDIKWYMHGHWFPRFEGSIRAFFLTRPLVEAQIFKRLKTIDNISIINGVRAKSYELDETGERVTGVSYAAKKGDMEKASADLVIDATGRGSLLPKWLSKNGFEAPTESNLFIDLCYCTTFYEAPDEASSPWALLSCYPKPPKEYRGGVISRVEGNRWHVTLAGYHGEHPPTEPDDYVEFAKSLPIPDLYNAIKDKEPLSPIIRHLFPSSMRRRYEQATHLPTNVLAIGDALCSLNPAFAQGISASALEVDTLHQHLEATSKRSLGLANLHQRFFKDVAKVIDQPWEMARNESLKYPETIGFKPLTYPIVRWYSDQITESSNPDIVAQFFEVMHLRQPITSLMTPTIFSKVLRERFGSTQDVALGSSETVHP